MKNELKQGLMAAKRLHDAPHLCCFIAFNPPALQTNPFPLPVTLTPYLSSLFSLPSLSVSVSLSLSDTFSSKPQL